MNSNKAWLTVCCIGILAGGLAVTSPAANGTGEINGVVKVRGVRNSADVVIYLEGGPKAISPPAKPVMMDQKSLTFVPHVLPVLRGAKVDFPNSDKVRHNVYSPSGSAKQFNLGTYPVGVVKTEQFETLGVVPLLCNVHSEMSAYILVLETPYYTSTDKFGRFELKDVAPGKYTLRVWHEKVKSVEQEVTVSAAKPVTVQIEMAGRK